MTGTIGSIHIKTSGGTGTNNLQFNFNNLLPGEPQTATVEYQNTGRSPEDVWVVFNNVEALHALNNLGTYGEVTITNGGGQVFDSANLNDNAVSCPVGSFTAEHPIPCEPLKSKYKIGSNIAPTAGGYMHFTFGYASKLQSQPPEGETAVPFNSYPVGTPTASGLPYQIVAVQVGQTP